MCARLHRARTEVYRLSRHRKPSCHPNVAGQARPRLIKGCGAIEDAGGRWQEKLAEALAHPGPVLIDAGSSTSERRCRVGTAEMGKGFTLYMLKAVVSMVVSDEIVELARSICPEVTRETHAITLCSPPNRNWGGCLNLPKQAFDFLITLRP